jgi:hypothetical protein
MKDPKAPEPMSQWFVLACSVALLYLAGNAALLSWRLDGLFFRVPGLALAADGWLAGLGIAACAIAGAVFATIAARNLWFRK